MNKFLVIIFLVLSTHSKAQTINERLTYLEDNLLNMQIEESKSNIDLSGNFVNRFESVVYDNKKQNIRDKVDIHRMELAVNMNADVNSRSRFYSTFSMAKNYNSFTKHNFN